MASDAIVDRRAVGSFVCPAMLVFEPPAGLIALLVQPVARVLRSILHAVASVGSLVFERLLAVGRAPHEPTMMNDDTETP